MARGSDKEAVRGGGGGGGGNDDHSDPEMSGSGHKKNFFFRPFGFQFDLKISGGSHEKFSFVLLQRTDYIYSP